MDDLALSREQLQAGDVLPHHGRGSVSAAIRPFTPGDLRASRGPSRVGRVA